MRDYYDIYILYSLYKNSINYHNLKNAIFSTSEKRNTLYILKNYKTILDEISQDSTIMNLWNRYRKTFNYVDKVSLSESLNIIMQIMNDITSEEK